MTLAYLDHYATLRAPGYAVLVAGEWGVGKTHQVTESLAPYSPLYVSLFGEPSVEAVHEAVVTASMPATTSARRGIERVVRGARQAAETVGGAVGGITAVGTDLVGSLALRQMRRRLDPERMLVFDDLERTSIAPKDISGLINTYLEHHGCRVVLIANESRLPNELKAIKEKLVGQTLSVRPRIEEAFAAFFGPPDAPVPPALRAPLHDVFVTSGLASLRHARQLVHDVERLLGELSERHRADDAALAEIILGFGAWSLEVRGGRLERHDVDTALAATTEPARQSPDTDDPSPCRRLDAAMERYRPLGIALHRQALHGALLADMLFDGEFDRARIRAALDASPPYRSAADLPAWKVLWWWQRFSGEELERAATQLVQALTDDPSAAPGTLLHRFARVLDAAHENLLDEDVSAIEQRCRDCIDRVRGALPRDETLAVVRRDAHDGLQFIDVGSAVSDAFERTREHLRETALAVASERLPDRARMALHALRDDGPERFARLLDAACPPEGYAVPVLATLALEDTLDHWLARSPDEQYRLAALLRARRSRLAEEDAVWIDELGGRLLERAILATRGEAFRLRALAEALTFRPGADERVETGDGAGSSDTTA